jgi:hypothetical protein
MDKVIANLKRLGVLRDSMLGDDWLVIYTEDGAKDITKKTLNKELSE